jgi:acetyltransferase-like isoleucine patch superfamily enzyme
MRTYLRAIGLLLTAVLPNVLKRSVYRVCFGYQIGDNVKIGVAFLDCDKLSVGDNARIASGVAFLRCGEVRIGEHAIIGLLNLFRGGDRIHLGDYSLVIRQNIINAIPDNDCTNHPDPSFYLGYGSVVTAEHRIDFTDRVTIGRCSIFGGRNSTIWTHNRRTGKPVEIGNHCYVGSEIRMAPGAKIPDCCIVGLGSVVTHAHEESFCLLAGVPAKKRRKLTADDRELIFGKTRNDLPEQVYPALDDAAAPTAISEPCELSGEQVNL